MPDEIQEPMMAIPVPQHGEHTVRDGADDLIDKENAERKRKLAEQSIGEIKGFTKAYQCPTCRRRIEPARSASGATSGQCPYCKTVGYPIERTEYAGDPNSKPLTNPYAQPVPTLFKEGAEVKGELKINRRFNARR